MKRVFLITAVTSLLASGAQAIEFNQDALKSMQQEGHKIVEEAQAGRAYKAANDFCLDTAGDGLVIRKCNAGSKTQKWTMDGQSRLVANDGRCLDGARLAKCTGTNSQKWRHVEKKRLANHNNRCLQLQDNKLAAGTRVVATACNNKAPGQVWK
jgi:hypothetical protein